MVLLGILSDTCTAFETRGRGNGRVVRGSLELPHVLASRVPRGGTKLLTSV